MRQIKSFLSMLIFKILPKSRCFYLKNFLLRIRGFNVSKTARIFSTVSFFGPKNITIGNDTFIGHETLLIGSYSSEIFIGNNVDISHRVTISTGTHEIDMNGKHTAGKGMYDNIIINDGVWIGMNSVILPGVELGRKSIVAAGSVVITNVPDYSIVAGNPARIKKKYDFKLQKWINYEGN